MKYNLEHFTNRRELVHALRAFIGNHAMPVEAVEQLTGIGRHTIRQHLDENGATVPNGLMLLAYCQLFGTAFSNMVLGLIGQGGVVKTVVTPSCPFTQLSESTRFSATLADFLTDRKLSHVQRAEMAPLADDRASSAAEFAAACRANEILEAA